MADLQERFKAALQNGKDSLALNIIEHNDKRTHQLLWNEREKPSNIIDDGSLAYFIDKPTWRQLSKQLHQSYRLGYFSFLLFVSMGCLILFGGIIEVREILKYSSNYLMEISSFCLVPLGCLFMLIGFFMLVTHISHFRKIRNVSKKKSP